jgi:hypothetical protein
MEKSYYIAKSRVNARISDTVIPGYHISIGGYVYELISRAPAGKRILKKFRSLDDTKQLVIYG